MNYDFHTMLERSGMDAMAVDALGIIPGMSPEPPKEGFDFLPMWVADMNFKTAPSIQNAIIERTGHPAFGYFLPRKEYYDAIIRWQKERNGVFDLTKKDIGYENGVLGGVVSALKAVAKPGSAVLLHSPTYIGFTKSIEANGYSIVLSPLRKDESQIWRMDYEDMRTKIREYNIRTAVFCSPHNPSGRVWERQELERAMEIFREYDCTVISDEIWSDLILPGYRHIPLSSVGDDAKQRTISLYAPSKTFNLAGLVGSYHVIYNPELRERVRKVSAATHYNDMNVLSMYALIGAYSAEGAQWVDELCTVLSENVQYVLDFFDRYVDGIEIAAPQGTYMLFLDCSEWCDSHNMTLDELLKKGYDCGVGWQDGRPFHGRCHIRMNLALPLSKIKEACERLGNFVFL